MPQQEGPRLAGRDGAVWREYLAGRTQVAIAADLGISQQRVSQIVAEVRASVGDRDRADMAMLDMERLSWLMDAQMPAAMKGDVGASRVVLAALARRAKMLGLDAAEPLRVTLDRDLDVSGELLAQALAAALDALGAGQEERATALHAAQNVLLGLSGQEAPSAPPSAPVAVPVADEGEAARAAMEGRLRDLVADEDIDVDQLLREVEGGRGDG